MRKYLYLLPLLLLIPAIYVYATDGVSGVEHPAKVNSVVTPDKVCGVSGLAAGGVSPDCSEDFNTSDTGDVAGNTNFDSESDATGKLDIFSNELRLNLDTVNTVAFVQEDTCVDNESEVTMKFTMEFEDVTGVANGADNLSLYQFFDNGVSNWGAYVTFWTDSSGNISTATVGRGGGAEGGNTVTLTGLAADTKYNCYLYSKIHATTGGAEFKIGNWAVSNTGFDDDTTGEVGIGAIQFGTRDNDWGDGTTDTYLYMDDFEVYKSDQR